VRSHVRYGRGRDHVAERNADTDGHGGKDGHVRRTEECATHGGQEECLVCHGLPGIVLKILRKLGSIEFSGCREPSFEI